jgi:hypothetical protein
VNSAIEMRHRLASGPLACAAAILLVAASPQPSPTVSASPAPAAQITQLPWNYDPCGGPAELLAKYGPTPCVVVGGEAVLSAGYTSAKIDGTITISGKAVPQLSATTNALVRSYPSAQATVGLGPFTDVQIIPPTYARVDTTSFPLLVSGSTDWKVGFKQRIEFNPLNGTITAVAAAIELPTGSPSLRAIAPAYSFDLIGEKAFQHGYALLYDMHAADTALSGGGRRWTLSPTILWAWESPGGLLAGAGGVILPNGKAVPMAVVEQLFSRHLGISVTYAGMGASGFATSWQPDLPIVNAINVNGNVNAISVALFGLIGKSGP